MKRAQNMSYQLCRRLLATVLSFFLFFAGTNVERAFAAEISGLKSKLTNKTSTQQSPKAPQRAPAKIIAAPKTALSAAPTDSEVRQLRIFSKYLVPMSGPPSANENAELANAISSYRNNTQDVTPIERFVANHPQSRWTPSLQNNIAEKKFKSGYFSEALKLYRSAWDRSKHETGQQQRIVADTAVAELLLAYSCFGRVEDMEKILQEIEGRDFLSDSYKVTQAKESLYVMKHNPGISFLCGPCALLTILDKKNGSSSARDVLRKVQSSSKGTNLAQLKDLSDKAGLNFQMAKRSAKAKILVPSVINWRVGHFGAIIESQHGLFHVHDTTFGGDADFWVSSDAIDKEGSGYFLVPAGPLPEGWTAVTAAEGQGVWGKGYIQARDNKKGPTDNKTRPCTCKGCDDKKKKGTGTGMAEASVFTMQATETIVDVPLSYPCPVGPPMEFKANYNYDEELPGSAVNCSNFGTNWKFNWVSYLEIDSNRKVKIALRDGGLEEFYFGVASFGSNLDNITNPYPPNPYSLAQLRVVGAGIYERVLPDGSAEVFSKDDGSQTRYFMTAVRDPQGNSATITYDANMRVTQITDAIGQVTTVSHGTGDGFYKITQLSVFSSPNTRTASFAYTATTYEKLLSITDAESMQSSFAYGTNSLITSMTTPYGTTTFAPYDPPTTNPQPYFPPRGLSITFPDSSVSKIENWGDEHAGVPKLNSTYFWSRYNVANGHYGDRDYAEQTVFQSTDDFGLPVFTLLPIIHSKRHSSLEDLITYEYPEISYMPGLLNTPSYVNQGGNIWLYQYNSFGHVTETTDPIGRKFSYKYAANDIDLLEVRETKGGDNFLLGKWQYSLQQPHTIVKYIDGSGRSTNYAYNTPSATVPIGQLASITDANSNVWTFTYDNRSPSTVDAFLVQTQGPLSGSADITTFEYDAAGNLKKTTDSEGYILEYEYDKLDRPTKTTYPDKTTELTTYNKLDVASQTDRLSRTTNYTYNVLGQVDTVTDPLSRVTDYDWCTCGALKKLTDPRGKITSWEHDRQGRVTKKTYADNPGSPDTTFYTYTYDTIGRLKERFDAITPTAQKTTYAYNADNTLSSITYANEINTTTDVTLTYDQNFNRLLTATNGWGTITYTYNPYIIDPFGTPTTGGGRLATVTNSVMASSTIAYTYDALGRVTERTINGSAHEIDWGYDAISRVTSETNELGQFNYAYVKQDVGPSHDDYGVDRLASIAYPSANNQDTNFTWYPNLGDLRLQRIENLTGAAAELSRFTYGYNAADEITQWYQRQNSTNTHRTTGYDLASQLTSAPTDSGSITDIEAKAFDDPPVLTDGDILTVTVLDYGLTDGQKSKTYEVQMPGDTLSSIASGLATGINGDTDLQNIGVTATSSSAVLSITSPSTRAVQYTVAKSANATEYLDLKNPTAKTPLGIDLTYTYDTGSNRTTEVVGGTTTTFNYNDVNALTSITGGATLTWDKNGNMTSDGTNTYAWDAENRLIQITYAGGDPDNNTKFTYDALGHCVKMEESTDASPSPPIVVTKQFIWCDNERCEERDGSNNLRRQFFDRGQVNISGTSPTYSFASYFYTKDHLGSIREVTNSSAAVQAQYSYDPYGKKTNVVTETVAADFQYAAMYKHERSGLNLTLYRAYKPDLGRWISRDPFEEIGGINLYAYVFNHPVNLVDPFGLFPPWLPLLPFLIPLLGGCDSPPAMPPAPQPQPQPQPSGGRLGPPPAGAGKPNQGLPGGPGPAQGGQSPAKAMPGDKGYNPALEKQTRGYIDAQNQSNEQHQKYAEEDAARKQNRQQPVKTHVDKSGGNPTYTQGQQPVSQP